MLPATAAPSEIKGSGTDCISGVEGHDDCGEMRSCHCPDVTLDKRDHFQRLPVWHLLAAVNPFNVKEENEEGK